MPRANLGELIAAISINDANFSRELEKASRSISSVSSELRGLGLAMTGMGAAITGVGAISLKNASDLQESIHAVNVVFKDAATTIQDFGKISALSAGLARADFNQLATQTGSLLQNFGFSAQEAADQTLLLTRRAADLASVHGGEVKDALFAINSALRGETEPIRRYAADVTDATLQSEALALGITKSVTSMSQSEKAALRLSSVMRQTVSVEGDFAATSGDLANQQRIVTAQMTNASANMGKAFTPAAEGVLAVLVPISGILADLAAQNPLMTQIIGGTGLGLLGIGAALTTIGFVAPAAASGFKLTAAGINVLAGASFRGVVAGIASIGATAAAATAELAVLAGIVVAVATAINSAVDTFRGDSALVDPISGRMIGTPNSKERRKAIGEEVKRSFAEVLDAVNIFNDGRGAADARKKWDDLLNMIAGGAGGSGGVGIDAGRTIGGNIVKGIGEGFDPKRFPSMWAQMQKNRLREIMSGFPLTPTAGDRLGASLSGLAGLTHAALEFAKANDSLFAALIETGDVGLAMHYVNGLITAEQAASLLQAGNIALAGSFDTVKDSMEATIALQERMARHNRAVAESDWSGNQIAAFSGLGPAGTGTGLNNNSIPYHLIAAAGPGGRLSRGDNPGQIVVNVGGRDVAAIVDEQMGQERQDLG